MKKPAKRQAAAATSRPADCHDYEAVHSKTKSKPRGARQQAAKPGIRTENKKIMPKILLCAIIEDNQRILFLEKTTDGKTTYSLPCTITDDDANPIQALKTTVLQQTGIDANVNKIAFTGEYNNGSRKRRQWIPAQAYSITTKNNSTKTPAKWMTLKQALETKLAKQTQWMKNSFR